MNRRVLFIAYLFPPIANSGTQRPQKFAKYLPRCGWDPVVLTAARVAEHPIDEGLLADLPPGVPIVRVPMLNDQIGRVAAGLAPTAAGGTRLAAGVSWRLRERFRTPDLYALWRPTARRAAMRIFRESGFDAIYATGFPWTSLLVGCDVSKATGCPLVADFRDPWAAEDLLTSGRPAHGVEFALESGVVRQAASVIAVSRTMTERMQAAHPDVDAAKFVTIPNGFDPPDLVSHAVARPSRFRIVYAGVWKAGYGPDALYDAIDRLRRVSPQTLADVEVVAAGFTPGEAARRQLSAHIREAGVLSHRDAVALMHSADILFLPNGDGARQQLGLPGKMFEYLATRRPVLAVTARDGDAGALIQRLGGGVVVDPASGDELLRLLAEACRAGRLAVPPIDPVALAAFERVALTRRLSAVLDRAVSPPPRPSARGRAPGADVFASR